MSRWKRSKRKLRCQDCRARFEGLPETKYCQPCVHARHRARLSAYWAAHKKYDWTAERDAVLKAKYDGKIHGRAAEIGRELGYPTWRVKKRAAELGLCYASVRTPWTKQEVAFLLEHAGSRTVQWMVKRLPGRTLTMVVLKLKRLRISRRWREGYTVRDLEECFGVDHHSLDRWIREGKLVGRRRGTDRKGPGGRPNGGGAGPGDPWVFTDANCVRFIREHPTTFRLDKVDQVWFLDLVIGGGLLRVPKTKEVA